MRVGYHLRSMVTQHGLPTTSKLFKEALENRKINPNHIRYPELIEAFLGRDYLDITSKLRAIAQGRTHLLEATEANDASAFAAITGQLAVTLVKEKYESPEFIGTKLVRTTPNPGANYKEHKVPYLSDVLTKGEKLSQGELYPYTNFSGSYVVLPAPEKYGQLCAITMEMMMSDLTGQVQDTLASLGRAMGYLKEERILRVVLGISNPYKWSRDMVTESTMNTYLSTEGIGRYINKKLNNTITNYTHVNDVEQLFWRMRDPVTERKIYIRPNFILCMPEKRYELKRVVNATEVRSGDITTGTGEQTVSANPLDQPYQILWSPIAQALLDDETALTASQIKEFVLFGEFAKAFGYREVQAPRVDVAPPLNPDEFKQDIIQTVKVSEYGVPYVYDPRFVALSTAESS